MPIRPDQRRLYPIDWRQLSRQVRFERARGRCEQCRRPHMRHVDHLGDGIWWDADEGCWRDGTGTALTTSPVGNITHTLRRTYVVLACAHLDHDPSNNRPGNLAALCQRCHMLHDREEHRYRRWYNAFVQRALRELFVYSTKQTNGTVSIAERCS